MLPNFVWFFLRNKLSETQVTEVKQYFIEIISKIIPDIRQSFPEYSFYLYNSKEEFDLKGDKKEDWTEIGIKIERVKGTYAYRKPLFRGFFGINNFLVYLNKLNPTVFPKIMTDDRTREIMEKIGVLLHRYVINEYKMTEYSDFFMTQGFHNCILNCATCCDASEHSRLPLEGGLYCKAMTNIGRFCLYKLFDIPLREGYDICDEYYCCDINNPISNCRSNLIGCQLSSFIPEYQQEDMDEFFSLMNRVHNIKNPTCIPESILNSTRRSKEIDLYWKLVEDMKDIMIEYKSDEDIFYQEFAELFNHNEFKKLIEKMNDSRTEFPEYLTKDKIGQVLQVLEELMQWQNMYDDRNSQYDYEKTTLYQ